MRTLAISQLVPTIILTWLPTWPDMATDGSLLRLESAAGCLASMQICEPEPAISITLPIGASFSGGRAGRGAG